jgi:uncharacterized membrane protein YvbJ
MALIQCPECNHQISDRAKNCPNCGHPIYHEVKTHTIEKEKIIVKNKEGCFLQTLNAGCMFILVVVGLLFLLLVFANR